MDLLRKVQIAIQTADNDKFIRIHEISMNLEIIKETYKQFNGCSQ